MDKITSTSWNEISPNIKNSNRPLFEVIDAYSELKKHDLKIYRYTYGSIVGDDKFFYTPEPSTNPGSHTIPFSMVLNNYFEMPIYINNQMFNWKMYKPGDVFPYTRFLPKNIYYEPSNWLSLIAGSASSFLLINKISDKKWHKLLCNKFKIDTPPPKSFFDHFSVFKSLVDAQTPKWSADLLVFSEKFFTEASKNHDFKELIFQISHQDKLFRRNMYAYELLLLNIFMNSKTIKSSFVRDCIKHILYAACGDLPSNYPTTNEAYAPISFLTDAYIHGFKSKSCPIFMTTDYLTPFENTNRSYFSLNKLDYLFKPEKVPSQAQIIRDIKSGFCEVSEEIQKSSISTTSIFLKAAKYLEIFPIIKGDINFAENIDMDEKLTSICKKYNLPFPENSTYLSSSLALSYNTQETLK